MIFLKKEKEKEKEKEKKRKKGQYSKRAKKQFSDLIKRFKNI